MALVLILLLALGLRLYRLVPIQTGLLYAQDADEGVHATVAQLTLQGYMPYRDFFTVIPPVSIYLFMLVLRIFYHPWGSPLGLMAMRYFSVAYGMATVFLVYQVGKRIGGRWSGLLAAVLVAIDGIVVAQDRRAMLEAPANLLSILAIYCCMQALALPTVQRARAKADRGPWVVGAGVFCSLALLTKGTALVLPAIILPALLLRRRWREALICAVAFAVSYVLLALPFLIADPVAYVKENYFFHMLRPWGGTVNPLTRLIEIWNYPWSWTTTRLALAGVLLGVLAMRKARHLDLWLVVCAWAGLLSLLLLTSRTYWATYFSQLAIPLAILGGSLLREDLEWTRLAPLDHWLTTPLRWKALQTGALLAILLLGWSHLTLQCRTTRTALEQVKPTYTEMTSYIDQHLAPGVPILVFEPNYTFLSSHPPAGAREGSFFVDSYGEMLYRNLGIPDASVSDLFAMWRHQGRSGTQEVFHGQPAQREVLAAFSRVSYIVLDGRGQKQLTPETSDYIRSHSRELQSAYAAELRERTVQPD